MGMKTFAKEPKLAKLLLQLKLMAVSCSKTSPLVFLMCLQWKICCVLGALLLDDL